MPLVQPSRPKSADLVVLDRPDSVSMDLAVDEQLSRSQERTVHLEARVQELESNSSQLEAYARDLSRTYAELRRYAQNMTVLHEVNTRIASLLDPQEVLDTLLDSLGQLVPFESPAVYLSELDVTVHLGGPNTVIASDPTARLQALRRSHAPELGDGLQVGIDTVAELSAAGEAIRGEQTVERHGELGVPLRAGGKVFGVFAVHCAEPLVEDQRRLVELLAAGAGVALQNAHLYQETQRLATTDSLTGLSNHRHFYELLQQESQRAHRKGYAVGLIMLDLDHFKRVNDLHGHQAGDAVLRRFAQVLRSRLRRTDAVGRLGGEEFAAILPDATLDEVTLVAEKVRRAVAEISPLQTDDGTVTTLITTSIGGATLTGQEVNGKLLLQQADEALYAGAR